MVGYYSSGHDLRVDTIHGMITWDFVPLHTIIDEMRILAPLHHAEIAEDDEPLNPDWDIYDAASRAGNAVAVTARHEGKLIGYIGFTVSRNLRHMHIIEATSSGWYIEPEYRGTLGPDIIKYADDRLKASGIHKTQFILIGPAAKLLARHGYKETHQVWEKKHG